jgi:hypothetical protein
MSDRLFRFALLPVAFVVFAGTGLILLVNPALHFRIHSNPFMADTPWNRLQMRWVGLIVCLFLSTVITGWLSGAVKSQLLEGFSSNILVALWITFIAGIGIEIASAILWNLQSFRSFIRSRYSSDKLQNRAWERRAALIFCALLLFIAGTALILAAEGYHA